MKNVSSELSVWGPRWRDHHLAGSTHSAQTCSAVVHATNSSSVIRDGTVNRYVRDGSKVVTLANDV